MVLIKLFYLRFGLVLLCVHKVHLTKKAAYVGCFKDKLGETMPDSGLPKIMSMTSPVSECIRHCSRSTNIFAGVKYHSTHMNCFCGNETQEIDSLKKAECNELCPDKRKYMYKCAGPSEISLYEINSCQSNSYLDLDSCEEDEDGICACSGNCSEDETDRKTPSATVPIVVTLILVTMVSVLIIISIRWRRHIRGNKQHSALRPLPVSANNEYAGNQTLPSTSFSNYSDIHDPYNYIDINPEGSLHKPNTCDDYSKVMPNGRYDCTNFKPQQNALDNANYNHIKPDELETTNNYSSTERPHWHSNFPTRSRIDDTYNRLTEDVHITAISESLADPEYNHTRANPSKVTLFDSKEYSHLAKIERE